MAEIFGQFVVVLLAIVFLLPMAVARLLLDREAKRARWLGQQIRNEINERQLHGKPGAEEAVAVSYALEIALTASFIGLTPPSKTKQGGSRFRDAFDCFVESEREWILPILEVAMVSMLWASASAKWYDPRAIAMFWATTVLLPRKPKKQSYMRANVRKHADLGNLIESARLASCH